MLTFGEAMVLLLAEPGTPLAEATSFRRTVAGSESNVAIGLARLGYRAGWFGRVGGDAFGDVVVRAMRGEGVDVSRVRTDPEAATGLLVRDCHEERPVDVLYFRAGSAGSRLSTDDVDAGYVACARYLHVTGITAVLSDDARKAAEFAVRVAKDNGVAVSFDPNVRRRLADPEHARDALRSLAAEADIVLAGDDEAELLGGTGWFLGHGARLVVTKHGARGATATDGTTTWREHARPVRVADPVGAGDAFAAGFLAGLLDAVPVPECLRRAAMLGALAVQVAGDTEGLPRRLPDADDRDVRR